MLLFWIGMSRQVRRRHETIGELGSDVALHDSSVNHSIKLVVVIGQRKNVYQRFHLDNHLMIFAKLMSPQNTDSKLFHARESIEVINTPMGRRSRMRTEVPENSCLRARPCLSTEFAYSGQTTTGSGQAEIVIRTSVEFKH